MDDLTIRARYNDGFYRFEINGKEVKRDISSPFELADILDGVLPVRGNQKATHDLWMLVVLLDISEEWTDFIYKDGNDALYFCEYGYRNRPTMPFKEFLFNSIFALEKHLMEEARLKIRCKVR